MTLDSLITCTKNCKSSSFFSFCWPNNWFRFQTCFCLRMKKFPLFMRFVVGMKKECFVKFCCEPHEKEHLEHNKIIYFLNICFVCLLFIHCSYKSNWPQHEIVQKINISRKPALLYSWESYAFGNERILEVLWGDFRFKTCELSRQSSIYGFH